MIKPRLTKKGGFHFHNLDIGHYSVIASGFRYGQMLGKQMYIEVKAGTANKASISITEGRIELNIKLDNALKKSESGLVYLFKDLTDATNGKEIRKFMKRTKAVARMKTCKADTSCSFLGLSPGKYTACICSFNSDEETRNSLGAVGKKFETLKACCLQLQVGESDKSKEFAFKHCKNH